MRRHLLTLVWCAGLAACSPPAAPPAQAPAETAVLDEAARLIADASEAPIESSAFVVTGDRITAVGEKGRVEAPPGARRVDLTGKTVINTRRISRVVLRGREIDRAALKAQWTGPAPTSSE